MKILLINDDGIQAAGLWAAARALRQVGEVFVVAPDREQSGVGAALTLRSPLRVEPVQVDQSLNADAGGPFPITAYSVDGTPGDSCILALESVVGRVDLVVSGINAGSNLGWDVLVSGTVGGAVQSYVRGFPTIAISVGAVVNPQFDAAGRLLGAIARRMGDTAAGVFLNVNLPSLPLDRIGGLKVTRLGRRSYGESVREENGGPGKQYRISRNRPIPGEPGDGTDIWALKNNYISVTPLQMNWERAEQSAEVEGLLAGISIDSLSSPDWAAA